MAILLAVFSVGAFAQFEKGTMYVNTSLSGLNLSYSKETRFSLGLNATAGYFLEDAWMLLGKAGYEYSYNSGDNHLLSIGAAGRYYIRQNGLYLGLGAKYEYRISEFNYETTKEDGVVLHTEHGRGNVFLTPELGYCFYLNHYLSIEPAVYYDISLNRFSDCSKIGVRLGMGFYF